MSSQFANRKIKYWKASEPCLGMSQATLSSAFIILSCVLMVPGQNNGMSIPSSSTDDTRSDRINSLLIMVSINYGQITTKVGHSTLNTAYVTEHNLSRFLAVYKQLCELHGCHPVFVLLGSESDAHCVLINDMAWKSLDPKKFMPYGILIATLRCHQI